MEINLFEIKLNEKTERLLPRINNWARFFYICTLVTSIVDIINGYIHIELYNTYAHLATNIQKIESIIDITFVFVYAILVPIQAYYLYLFTKGSNRSLQYGSSEEFNLSFEWLFKHAMIASILFLINSIWGIGQIYFGFKILMR